jgi:SAM-dependent methyltransferase
LGVQATATDAASTRAPGIPPGYPADYYRSIYAAEDGHWWHRGMREVSGALLRERLEVKGGAVLDAGSGTGGFLRWLLTQRDFQRACGVDISPAGVELARGRVPDAEFHVAPIHELPFAPASFDLVVCNDVLQHVTESDVQRSLDELRRVIAPGGALLLRTNGALKTRRERDDWRAYDRRTLVALMENAGLRCERVTSVNMIPSLWDLARGRVPHAPTEHRHGVAAPPGRLRSVPASLLLRLEARHLASPGRRLPYGHTQIVVAVPVA